MLFSVWALFRFAGLRDKRGEREKKEGGFDKQSLQLIEERRRKE
jgi:hypothetical protein